MIARICVTGTCTDMEIITAISGLLSAPCNESLEMRFIRELILGKPHITEYPVCTVIDSKSFY